VTIEATELRNVTAYVNDPSGCAPAPAREKDVFIDYLLVRIHFIIEMIWWTGLAPASSRGSRYLAARYL